MNKYQKVIDYEKHEAKFFGNINGITMEVSKDIIIDDYEKEIERYKKFVDDILNFYEHNRYEEELTEDNMFKFVLNQNEMIMTIEEFKEGKKWK